MDRAANSGVDLELMAGPDARDTAVCVTPISRDFCWSPSAGATAHIATVVVLVTVLE